MTLIDEEMKPRPKSAVGAPPVPRFELDVDGVIDKYRALHEAGVVEWDAVMRGLYLQPIGSHWNVLEAWARSQQQAD